MKQKLLNLCAKIDALTLRERGMVFAAAAGALIFLVNMTLLDPLLKQQKSLRAKIGADQNSAIAIDAEIALTAQIAALDPDAADRDRLRAIQAEIEQLGADLRSAQKGLVSPDKMASLLETILKGHGQLRLISLKTLPVSGAGDGTYDELRDGATSKDEKSDAQLQGIINSGASSAIAAAIAPVKSDGKPNPAKPGDNPAAAAAAAAKLPELLYRHGVEITLQGGYQDMVNYMTALEHMPSQLFWATAKLDVLEYPSARLTLALYTLSLDKKWIAL